MEPCLSRCEKKGGQVHLDLFTMRSMPSKSKLNRDETKSRSQRLAGFRFMPKSASPSRLQSASRERQRPRENGGSRVLLVMQVLARICHNCLTARVKRHVAGFWKGG